MYSRKLDKAFLLVHAYALKSYIAYARGVPVSCAILTNTPVEFKWAT